MISLTQNQEMPDSLATVAMMKMQIEGLPKEKVEAMVEFAKKLRKNNPNMKPARLQRKVAEEFHINIV